MPNKLTLGERIYKRKGIDPATLKDYKNRQRWKIAIKLYGGRQCTQNILFDAIDEWRAEEYRRKYKLKKVEHF